MMPHMVKNLKLLILKDGLELLSLMKGIDSLKDLPVIMMSSDSEMEIIRTCMGKGAADYLVKPIR